MGAVAGLLRPWTVADGLLPAVPPELMSGDAEMRWLVEEQDGQLVSRRLAGIGLGIASRHSVRVLEAAGQVVCRSSCVPTAGSLTLVERAAAARAAGTDAAALDRRVRGCERLTRASSEHKVRIKDLLRQLMPMTPLTGDPGKAGLAVLERYAGPARCWPPAWPGSPG